MKIKESIVNFFATNLSTIANNATSALNHKEIQMLKVNDLKNQKSGVMSVGKSKIKLDMTFDARDVIDILVSEQEQNLENAISNLQFDLEEEKKKSSETDKQFQSTLKSFVKEKYIDQILLIEQTLQSIGANAVVKYEIIDQAAIAPRRRLSVSKAGKEFDRELTDEDDVSNDEKFTIALIICNKDMTRDTVDNSVSFYFETAFNDSLKELNKQKQILADKISKIQKELNAYKAKLESTDRLVRRARAAVTKKAIGQDISELIRDFREQYPQIELKKND